MSTIPSPETPAEDTPEARLAYRKALRKTMVERRQYLPAEELTRMTASLCAHLRREFPELARMRVGFCWPMLNEPDLRPLVEAWIGEGDPGFVAMLKPATSSETSAGGANLPSAESALVGLAARLGIGAPGILTMPWRISVS